MRNWRRWARFGDAARPGSASVRLRLTVLYAGLFLLSGVALLTISYLLVRAASTTTARHAMMTAAGPRPVGPVKQHSLDLHNQLVASIVALGFMTVISAVLGWLVAGRVLAPIRTMTVAARRISEDNLTERLDVHGPDDELKLLGDTIDELIARLQAAFESQRRFVANAAHELRTPLATMRASLDVAAAKPEPVPPHITGLQQRLRDQLAHLEALLEGLLALARAEHGQLSDRSTVSLGEIAIATVSNNADAIHDRRLEVIEDESGDALVIGSRALLERMVENVVDNAIVHNAPGGWVQISTATEDHLVELIVENSGPALSENDIGQLGQPFRRAGAERTATANGSGLGLSIVSSIVRAHGGELALRARDQGGLRLQIQLPAATAQPDSGGRA
jgi:signal transduction histidine kinase